MLGANGRCADQADRQTDRLGGPGSDASAARAAHGPGRGLVGSSAAAGWRPSCGLPQASAPAPPPAQPRIGASEFAKGSGSGVRIVAGGVQTQAHSVRSATASGTYCSPGVRPCLQPCAVAGDQVLVKRHLARQCEIDATICSWSQAFESRLRRRQFGMHSRPKNPKLSTRKPYTLDPETAAGGKRKRWAGRRALQPD
jgi:hypothetical protein